MKILKSALALSLLASGLMAIPVLTPAAHACGGFFCSLQQPVDQAAERILFAKDGEDMVAHVQIQYTGPSENFSWIVPVPSEPELGIGSDELFQTLRATTRPQFNIQVTTEGECRSEDGFFDRFGAPTAGAALDSASAESARVQVLSQEQVGPFESVVLKGDDPETLKQWLRDNGYDVPPQVDPLLDPYIKNDMLLLALKLRKDRTDGDLKPIVMRYKADKPMIPIQLTAVAAEDDMDVQVWLLGEERAIPVNYPHVKINEARINWLQQGSNYRSVVTEAMNEAGGRAFVTEYAGESSAVDLSVVSAESINPENLRPLTDPLLFAEGAREFFTTQPLNTGGRPGVTFQQDQYISFLSRHIPKPDDAQQVDNDVFYGNLQRYADSLERAEITVNTANAIQELMDTLVKPRQDIARLFEKHAYLTALYTTLSPEEMTVDPTFDYNPDLEDVSAQRNATGVRKCHGGVTFSEAPIEITTPSGLKYTFQPPVDGGGSAENNPTLLPAAAVVQTLSTSGPAVTIRDESERLNRVLAPDNRNIGVDSSGNTVRTAAGCACHSPNTPVPVSEGAGEGFSYAVAILGFLGWRKWRQRH